MRNNRRRVSRRGCELPAGPADRYAGAMLGLACSDALGAPAEFLSPQQMEGKFGRLTTVCHLVALSHAQW